jgi:sporulation protein YlmC with PRC-barrel domain
MTRTLLALATASTLSLSVALAQSPPSAPPAPSAPAASSEMGSAANTITAQKPDEWLATRLRGTSVLGSDGVKIGSVDDILLDRSGSIKALVIGVGGFLGIGAKDVALPPSAFQVVQGKDSNDVKLKLSMTKDQLKTAADFKSHKMLAAEQRRTTTGAGGPGGMAPRAPGALPGSTNR